MAASPHSDSMMISMAILSLYLLIEGRRINSFFFLAISAITKIVSGPMLLVTFIPKKFSRYYRLLYWITSLIGTTAIILKWSINPWYLLLPFTFGVFFHKNKAIAYFLISMSMAALVRYLPYFYLGFFDPGNKIRLVLFLLAFVPYIFWYIFSRFLK